jgi:Mg2+/Co2+ transporter CorB
MREPLDLYNITDFVASRSRGRAAKPAKSIRRVTLKALSSAWGVPEATLVQKILENFSQREDVFSCNVVEKPLK